MQVLRFALLASLASTAAAQCETDRVLPSDPHALDHFGTALALDGQTLLVGAPGSDSAGQDAGAAYVFRLGPSGWAETQRLVAGGGSSGFGSSVALDGRRALVGAIASNSAFVFDEVAGVWTETARLEPSNGTPGDRFGDCVALFGDVAVVGSPWSAPSGLRSGSVYVFEKQGASWTEVARVEPAMPESFDEFGHAVALEGGRFVVGSPNDRLGAFNRPGAVYVFEDLAGAWTEVARIPSPSGHHGFGSTVSLSGDRLAIGAPVPGVSTNFGAAYVYERQGGAWARTLDFSVGPGVLYDRLGHSVSIEGDRLAVGSPLRPFGPAGYGVAYAFRRVASTWTLETMRAGGDAARNFGITVAVSDRFLMAGASDGPFDFSGSVWPGMPAPYEVEAFCFCTGASCHNEDPLAGCANASGSGARLVACNSTSVALDDLVLRVENAIPGQAGILFMGAVSQPPVFFGNGTRCIDLAPGLFRFPVRFPDPSGTLIEGPGVVAHTQASFPPAARIDAGETWHFQCWYRDPGACGTGSNLSNALSVTFAP